MVTFVLDSSAVLRYIDGETGSDRVEYIFGERDGKQAQVAICAVHWAEVIYILLKRLARDEVQEALEILQDLRIEIVPVTAERAQRAASIRHRYRIPFADAFGVELAGTSPQHLFVTADFDVKPAEADYPIEFLPVKS